MSTFYDLELQFQALRHSNQCGYKRRLRNDSPNSQWQQYFIITFPSLDSSPLSTQRLWYLTFGSKYPSHSIWHKWNIVWYDNTSCRYSIQNIELIHPLFFFCLTTGVKGNDAFCENLGDRLFWQHLVITIIVRILSAINRPTDFEFSLFFISQSIIVGQNQGLRFRFHSHNPNYDSYSNKVNKLISSLLFLMSFFYLIFLIIKIIKHMWTTLLFKYTENIKLIIRNV